MRRIKTGLCNYYGMERRWILTKDYRLLLRVARAAEQFRLHGKAEEPYGWSVCDAIDALNKRSTKP